MNKTKKLLIILAIVFALADIAFNIYDVVVYFSLIPSNRRAIIYIIFDFAEILISISIMVMLTIAIWGNGKHFRERYRLYMISLMLSFIVNLFSISTILLICSMFVSDITFETSQKVNDMPDVEIINETKEEKIAKLREKFKKGEISQEEFEKEIIDLL